MQFTTFQFRLGLFFAFMSRSGNILRLLLSVGLCFSYFFFHRIGYGDGSGLCSHLFYIFSHANIWHLLANIVCIWLIRCPFHLVAALLVSVLCSFIPCFVSGETYGFSGVLFGVVGISWGIVGRFKDMLLRNKWYFLIPFMLPHVNACLHLYCALLGYLFGYYAYRKSERYKLSEIL